MKIYTTLLCIYVPSSFGIDIVVWATTGIGFGHANFTRRRLTTIWAPMPTTRALLLNLYRTSVEASTSSSVGSARVGLHGEDVVKEASDAASSRVRYLEFYLQLKPK